MTYLRLCFKKFCGHDRGATAIEMAILLPIFLAIIFGVMEFSRLQWTQQSLEELSYKAARCASMDNDLCATDVLVKDFIAAEGAQLGYNSDIATVTVELDVQCAGLNAHKVTIDQLSSSPVANLLPMLPERIIADACFPIQTPS